MKKKTIILTTLIFLGFAGSLAMADHDAINPEDRVRVLAYEMENATNKLLRSVDRSSHHYSYWEGRAVDEALRLNRQAALLSRKLDRRYSDPYEVNRQLRRMDRQLDRTSFAIRHMHAKNIVRKRLRDTRFVFRELTRANRDFVASSRRFGVELRHKNVHISADLGWLFDRDRFDDDWDDDRREARKTRRAYRLDD